MTPSQNSAPRTDVPSSIDFKSQQNETGARATDTRSRPTRPVSGVINVALRPLKDCRGMPNNSNPLGALPETGYVCQSQLVPAIFPFSSATLWRKVKAGTFPRPVKLGPRITAWRVEDIHNLIERLGR
jgi:prophage regulatory protein